MSIIDIERRNMSYLDFDFPNTRFYESDLRELIKMCKELTVAYNKLVSDIDELNAWRQEHQGEYEELVRKVAAVEQEMVDFEALMNAKFNQLDAQIQNEFSELKADINNELRLALEEFNRMFRQLRTQIESDISNMKIEIRELLNYLNQQIININENVIEYVNDRFNDFIAHLPDYEKLIIYNPVVGRQTTIQEAIIDLYMMFAVFGITAEQYDSLQLTAAEFDAKRIIAKDYDMLAYQLLDYPDPNYFMRDPFNGRFEKNKVVIWKLADLHRLALTASEYDALEMPAETFDGLNLTAYYFDWYGINIGTSAITATEFDALEIEAEPYDDKRISAYDYDNYAKLILSTI